MRSVLSDILSVFKSKMAIIALGLIKGIIIARYLGPELNGVLSALLVYPGLFTTIGALGVRKSSAYYIGTKKFEERSIYHAIIHLWAVSSLFTIVATFLFMYFLMANQPSFEYLVLVLIPLPFALFNTYLSGVFLGKNQIKEFNSINWIPALFTTTLVAVFVIGLKTSLEGVLLAELFAPLVMNVILLMKIGRKELFSFKINFSIIYAIAKLGVAFAFALLLLNLNYRLDIIIMEKLSNSYEIGIYGKGAALTQYLWQIPMLLGTIVFARSARAKDRKLFSLKVCQLLRVSLLLIGAAGIFLGVFSKYLILSLFGKEFLPSATVIIYLLPGVFLLTIFKVLNMDVSGQGKPLFVLKSMGVALVVNVILNILFIPEYGANGAALSSTISYSVGALIFIWQYSNFTNIPIKTILNYDASDMAVIRSIFVKFKILKAR